VHVADAFEAQQQATELSSQAKTGSMVLKRSSKIAGSKCCLRACFGVFRPRCWRRVGRLCKRTPELRRGRVNDVLPLQTREQIVMVAIINGQLMTPFV
jgi:hypothetical protein